MRWVYKISFSEVGDRGKGFLIHPSSIDDFPATSHCFAIIIHLISPIKLQFNADLLSGAKWAVSDVFDLHFERPPLIGSPKLPTFLEFNERTTKSRQGLRDTCPFHPKMWTNCRNPERCPLCLYTEYKRHRPYDMREPDSLFYLGVNFKRAPSAECWFQRQPMGKNSLGTMMKVTAEKAGIKGKFTNHSTGRTSISQLMANEVPPVVMAQLSGHKNVQSIMRYSTASRAQQEGMFKILTIQGNTITGPYLQLLLLLLLLPLPYLLSFNR